MTPVDWANRPENAPADFRSRVLSLIVQVPEGNVATYGQIARLAGHPRAARQVGMVLRGLSEADAERVPWQRIINAQGGISTYKVGSGELQRALLESEGIVFGAEGTCDLERFQTQIISHLAES